MSNGSRHIFTSPSEEAQNEALKRPNGYVYVLEKEYRGKGDVPSNAIIGAWKVDGNGKIVGPFVPNPNHKGNLN